MTIERARARVCNNYIFLLSLHLRTFILKEQEENIAQIDFINLYISYLFYGSNFLRLKSVVS